MLHMQCFEMLDIFSGHGIMRALKIGINAAHLPDLMACEMLPYSGPGQSKSFLVQLLIMWGLACMFEEMDYSSMLANTVATNNVGITVVHDEAPPAESQKRGKLNSSQHQAMALKKSALTKRKMITSALSMEKVQLGTREFIERVNRAVEVPFIMAFIVLANNITDDDTFLSRVCLLKMESFNRLGNLQGRHLQGVPASRDIFRAQQLKYMRTTMIIPPLIGYAIVACALPPLDVTLIKHVGNIVMAHLNHHAPYKFPPRLIEQMCLHGNAALLVKAACGLYANPRSPLLSLDQLDYPSRCLLQRAAAKLTGYTEATSPLHAPPTDGPQCPEWPFLVEPRTAQININYLVIHATNRGDLAHVLWQHARATTLHPRAQMPSEEHIKNVAIPYWLATCMNISYVPPIDPKTTSIEKAMRGPRNDLDVKLMMKLPQGQGYAVLIENLRANPLVPLNGGKYPEKFELNHLFWAAGYLVADFADAVDIVSRFLMYELDGIAHRMFQECVSSEIGYTVNEAGKHPLRAFAELTTHQRLDFNRNPQNRLRVAIAKLPHYNFLVEEDEGFGRRVNMNYVLLPAKTPKELARLVIRLSQNLSKLRDQTQLVEYISTHLMSSSMKIQAIPTISTIGYNVGHGGTKVEQLVTSFYKLSVAFTVQELPIIKKVSLLALDHPHAPPKEAMALLLPYLHMSPHVAITTAIKSIQYEKMRPIECVLGYTEDNPIVLSPITLTGEGAKHKNFSVVNMHASPHAVAQAMSAQMMTGAVATEPFFITAKGDVEREVWEKHMRSIGLDPTDPQNEYWYAPHAVDRDPSLSRQSGKYEDHVIRQEKTFTKKSVYDHMNLADPVQIQAPKPPTARQRPPPQAAPVTAHSLNLLAFLQAQDQPQL